MAQKIDGGLAALERGLVVGSEGPKPLALIGGGRARELAVNVVLPFTVAWGKRQGRVTLADAATTLYHKYPKNPDNEITREMMDFLVPLHWRTRVDSACLQQGLLHMQRLLARADFRTEG